MRARADPGCSAAPGSARTAAGSKTTGLSTWASDGGHRAQQPHGAVHVLGVEGEGHGRQQVVVLGSQAGTPLLLARSDDPPIGAPGELDVVIGVAGPQGVGLAGLGQPLLAVLADGLE